MLFLSRHHINWKRSDGYLHLVQSSNLSSPQYTPAGTWDLGFCELNPIHSPELRGASGALVTICFFLRLG